MRSTFRVLAALLLAVALVSVPSGGVAHAADPTPVSTNPPPTGPGPTEPATTVHVVCHELANQEFSIVDSLTGRLDSNTVMVGFHTYLSGDVRYYVDGVYRSHLYIDVRTNGGTFTLTFANTHLAHRYDAFQTADPAYSYPGARVWYSTGIPGVVLVGANHCQTPKRTV